LDSIIKAVQNTFKGKLAEKNVTAIKLAYEMVA